MKEKKKNIIVVILILLVVAVLMILTIFTGGVTMNPAGTIGNTAGNLNNSGLFCEYDGTVYFSNPYDKGTLYAMDVAESNIRKLNNVRSQNILAGGKYLYYFQNASSGGTGIGSVRSVNSFNRCKLDGTQSTGLIRNVVVAGQLVDNYLYLMVAADGPEFYKMKIDKSEMVTLAKYNINPASAVNGIIYYNGVREDHYLYALDTATDVSTVVWKGNLWSPVVEGDYVYYLDVENNYRLCRYSFSQDTIQVLTNDRVDCFNVGYGYIYYQKNSETEPRLIGMYPDGSNVTVIAEGNYTNINMTSQYVYFQSFGIDFTMYHMVLGGSQYSDFGAAKTAASENSK